ncbi:hypothetical protein TVAG_402020 [Trichomonas vaginalis G3]|uniref:DUF3447 domain-containing protein n=1 Tax=Trichomonas vaginalis (strain ATCC PRA-98 / G3) TaxID=412133 RepID=A2DHV9_TRIV3|nr:hypothetical protein TVAG_402020 [Trichomonas vaginalis G3]|eukprot:XP_001580934.1 hypothetical protein [Trichomonas vaginalis G3]
MSDQEIHPNEYSKLWSAYKYYIDSYKALYQLKTDKEEEINSIYKMIKTELIDLKKHLPQNIIRNILNIIPLFAYLSLAKLISDEYHVQDVYGVQHISNFLFYREYGIKLYKYEDFEKNIFKNLDIHNENTIYRAIMQNDKETFITFTEREGFDKDQKLECDLYPSRYGGYSLLELCCYHGAVDCFKLLMTKFHSKITQTCLELSFLGRNAEIMSECLKHQKPNDECMKNAIASHNIDFVTFLMNEYNININLYFCGYNNNIESFLVYFDQTNDVNKCLIYSTLFNIPPLCKYFLSHGATICKDLFGKTALHIAACCHSKETIEVLISHGANINEKDKNEQTALHYAACNNSKESAEILISHGANINEKDLFGKITLHYAVWNKYRVSKGVFSTNLNTANRNKQVTYI